jgi:hypothetical protein
MRHIIVLAAETICRGDASKKRGRGGALKLMDELKAVEAMGLTLPSAAYLAGAILFGIIGYAAYRYGKKATLPAVKWIGVALMLYPYAISETWQLYGVGAGLCVALYVYRR